MPEEANVEFFERVWHLEDPVLRINVENLVLVTLISIVV